MPPGAVSRLLEEVRPAEGAPAFTLYVPPGQPLTESWERGWHLHPFGETLDRAISRAPEVAESRTGAIFFGSEGGAVVVLPPFPVTEGGGYDRWDTDALMALLRREYTIGLVMLRLGRYAVGIFRGSHLIESKTDTRYVKGRHHAGGTSQKRFERIRDKQVRELFDKTCSMVREKLGPFEREIEYISLGGERHTLLGLLDRCEFLQRLRPRILPRTLDIRVPNRESLERALAKVYESRVITF